VDKFNDIFTNKMKLYICVICYIIKKKSFDYDIMIL